jgi:hypothetical protein
MPEKASAGTPTAQYGCQQHIMDTDSTMWTPTTYEFFAEIRQKLVRVAKKIREEKMLKKSKNSLVFLSDRFK